MSRTYDGLVADLQNLLQQDPNNPNATQFQDFIPTIIDNAEQRIYREIPFLTERRQTSPAVTVSGENRIDITTATTPCVTVEQFALFTPAGATAPPLGQGVRVNYLGPVSLDFLNMVWPDTVATSAPGAIQGYWAMYDDKTVVLAPTPDGAYYTGMTGLFRPETMSATNQTTYLGTNYPDLLLSACMILGAAWERNFGSQADDPKMASSWEQLYEVQKTSALAEEGRRRGESVGWTAMAQFQATPPRT